MSDFAGKTALVTGAASGIGAATARALAENGVARLILVDVDAAGLDALDLPCEVSRHVGSVADEALHRAIEQAEHRLDAALLNAGIATGGLIADLPFDEWRRQMSVNLDGAFLSLRSALRMANDGAAIVLTASVAGLKAEPGAAAYAVSKAGVLQLARAAAKELAARGIRVNAIAPGGVDTAIWDGMSFFDDLVAQNGGDRAAAIAAMGRVASPLGRFASAEEIAAQALFLLSDAAVTITGATLVSDGGYLL